MTASFHGINEKEISSEPVHPGIIDVLVTELFFTDITQHNHNILDTDHKFILQKYETNIKIF
jgi:hypothetical protein